MSDLLSSASLLLAIIGVLYGIWYADIVNATNIVVKEHYADRGSQRDQVTNVKRGKALPLAIIASLLTLTFLPDAIEITFESFSVLKMEKLEAYKYYNAVKAAFCLVVALLIGLTSYAWVMVAKLNSKLRKINQKDT
jgi:hypothetical protein